MSRYHGNAETCPSCGVSYGRFRTGLTYRDVWLWFYDESDDRSEWRYKRRGTVLGAWHQHKRELWAEHLSLCGGGVQALTEGGAEDVPPPSLAAAGEDASPDPPAHGAHVDT